MDAKVKALGYAVVAATDLDEWVRFGTQLVGLQVARRDDDRVLFRMDHHAYRFDVRRAAESGVLALGWEVGGPEALASLTSRLIEAGYQVDHGTPDLIAERMVVDLVRFRDPEDVVDHELFWGLTSSTAKFVSPIGASFVAGELGLGHVFQALHHGNEPYNALFREILGFRLSDHIDMPGDLATFLHCNPRHHTFAFVNAPHRPAGIGHFMVEIDDMDLLGRQWDLVQETGVPILSTLGKHTNDEMMSFYFRTPSGFGIELGVGGILIDDATWVPVRYDSAHYWGHKRPTVV